VGESTLSVAVVIAISNPLIREDFIVLCYVEERIFIVEEAKVLRLL
jgi:hypothetical protein